MTLSATLAIDVHEEDGRTGHLVLPPPNRQSEADMRPSRAGGGGGGVAHPGRDGVLVPRTTTHVVDSMVTRGAARTAERLPER